MAAGYSRRVERLCAFCGVLWSGPAFQKFCSRKCHLDSRRNLNYEDAAVAWKRRAERWKEAARHYRKVVLAWHESYQDVLDGRA